MPSLGRSTRRPSRIPAKELYLQRFFPRIASTQLFLIATVALPTCLNTVGCTGARLEQMQTEITTLRDEVEELKRSQAAARVQFDEFRNRLVMIEEKADMERVAKARRDDSWIPKLPTVKVQNGDSTQRAAVAALPARVGQHSIKLPENAPENDDDDVGPSPSGPADDLPPQTLADKPTKPRSTRQRRCTTRQKRRWIKGNCLKRVDF